MWDSVLDPKYFACNLEIILAFDIYKPADNLKRKFPHMYVCMFVAVVVAATVSTDSYQLYKAKSTGD
jgi:putative effector of murein hydrolase